jgi:hypothetical protein
MSDAFVLKFSNEPTLFDKFQKSVNIFEEEFHLKKMLETKWDWVYWNALKTV